MPRQAHTRPLTQAGPSKPAKKKAIKGRGLNALQLAEEANPEEIKIRSHRLGESYDDPDEPRGRQDDDERSSKRRKVEHDEDAEDGESGSDPDGKRWHVGVEEDDEDSDIDSDDAFGDSDQEKFADFTFRGSKGNAKELFKGRQQQAVPDSEDDDLGDDAVDLATALDMNEATENQQPTKKRRKRSMTPEEESDEFDSDDASDGDNSDQDMDVDSQLSVSDQDDGDHDRLQNFVQSLSTKKESNQNRALESSTLGRSKISAADLLDYVKDPQQRQSLKILQNTEIKGPEPYKGGIPGRLAPPLVQRQQDRLDRVAAYDQSKKELGKWVDTVKQNRRAEHLFFPLPDPDATATRNDQIAPISQSKTMSSLETKIQEIMQESGLSGKAKKSADKEEQEFEELQENRLPLAEVQARRAALRQARDLMFREEIRAKRIKKIKSKTYRRVHRKERDRNALRERAEMAADGLIDSEEDREKNDRRRAEERMGERHRESKWAKSVKITGRAAWDNDARGGVSDLARRDEELRRRIEGKEADKSDFSDDESASDGYDSGADEADLQGRLAGVTSTDSTRPGSKLESMAFMRRAEATKKTMNDATLRELRQQFQGDEFQADSDESETEAAGGRQTFGGKLAPVKVTPAKVGDKSDFEEQLSGDEDGADNLVRQETSAPTLASQNTSSSQAQTSSKGRQQREQRSQSRQQDVSASQLRQAPKPQPPRKSILQPSKRQEQILEPPSYESDADSSSPITIEPTTPNPDPTSNEPRTLSEAIFFGDDTLSTSFAAEKAEAIASEDDQPLEDPNALPGWGSWTGAGISKKAQKRALMNAKQKSNTKHLVVKGVRPEARKDKSLEKVIINEKTVKKNNKYLATELPHPFETRAQYERSLRLPVGPEWSTKRDFQDGVKPRVIVRQGVVRAVSRPVV